jgi:hypothetical protein
MEPSEYVPWRCVAGPDRKNDFVWDVKGSFHTTDAEGLIPMDELPGDSQTLIKVKAILKEYYLSPTGSALAAVNAIKEVVG